tara:strand:+ start:482 stop:1537 length:1056 start_codon:yes stop_codon:yes gene_type:complete
METSGWLVHGVGHKILHTIGVMENNDPSFGNPNSDEYCPDYIKLPKLKQLSRKINSRIPLEKGRTSTNNIENFLIKMTKHLIRSKPFKDRPVISGLYGLYPLVDETKTEADYMSCIITNEGVYVHMQHIRKNLSSSMNISVGPEIDLNVLNEFDIRTPNILRLNVVGAEIIRLVSSMNVESPIYEEPPSGDFSSSYLRLAKLKKLCKEVAHQFDIERPIKYCNVCALDIERFFTDLSKTSIRSRFMRLPAANRYPEEDPYPRTREKVMLACQITPSGVYLHTKFLLHKKDKKRPRESSSELETRSVLARKSLKGVQEQLKSIQGLSASLKNQIGIMEESIRVRLDQTADII